MAETFRMVAKTFKGLEEVLATELKELGAEDIKVERRAVSYTGDLRLLYLSNLWLRTASRVLKPIAVFKAKDAETVYNNVKQIDWEQYMSVDSTFSIDTTVFSEYFNHSLFVTYRAKDAIVDFFREKYDKRPNVRTDNAEMLINVHISHDIVTISLDSSGESLHKRGWRAQQTAAPINEALAAGLLMLAGWKGETDFIDPMCGSGTILIEAAMIALNIPPGIYRQGFAFEKWKDFDPELFEELYNDDSKEREFKHHIYGSDSAFYAIQVAEKNVKSAGLQKYISLHQCQIQNLTPPAEKCLIVTNPPYGERLDSNDIMQLYGEIGVALKHKFVGSTAWLISSNTDALKHIGLKHSEKIKVLNGDLDCFFQQYELFAGERKSHLAKENNNKEKRVFKKDDRKEGKKEYKKDDKHPFKKEGRKELRKDDKRRPFSDKRSDNKKPFSKKKF